MTEPQSSTGGNAPGLDDVIELVERLANDEAFREKFKKDPRGAVAEAEINVGIPDNLAPPLDDLPSSERYQMLLVVLNVQRFGFNLQARDGMYFITTFYGPTATSFRGPVRKFYGPA